jgi:hypothetical protein
MISQRLPCKSSDCRNTILPATASVNDGYCMPCVQKRKSAQWEEYVRLNRREVNQYEGIADHVEIIRLACSERGHDPLVRFAPPPLPLPELFAGLSGQDVDRLTDVCLTALVNGNETLCNAISRALAAFTDHNLDRLAIQLVERCHLWPSIVFRNAGGEVRQQLLRALESGVAEPNHALLGLAWIGDDQTVDTFRRWKANPPAWIDRISVSPDKYAHEAGWELSAEGRRELFHRSCYQIIPIQSEQEGVECLTIAIETDKRCPWCGRLLLELLLFDTSQNTLEWSRVAEAGLSVLTCDLCTAFGTGLVFSNLAADGSTTWHDANERPDRLPDKLDEFDHTPWEGVAAKLKPRRPFEAADWCLEVSASQLGGMPTWIQESAYPSCPDCGQTMKFIAQLDNADFPMNEGIYYAFFCETCRVTATTYQQS